MKIKEGAVSGIYHGDHRPCHQGKKHQLFQDQTGLFAVGPLYDLFCKGQGEYNSSHACCQQIDPYLPGEEIRLAVSNIFTGHCPGHKIQEVCEFLYGAEAEQLPAE